MPNNRNIAIFQVLLVVFCSLGVWQYSLQDNIENTNQSKIELIDSNGNLHFFEETPQRVAITNTYAKCDEDVRSQYFSSYRSFW